MYRNDRHACIHEGSIGVIPIQLCIDNGNPIGCRFSLRLCEKYVFSPHMAFNRSLLSTQISRWSFVRKTTARNAQGRLFIGVGLHKVRCRHCQTNAGDEKTLSRPTSLMMNDQRPTTNDQRRKTKDVCCWPTAAGQVI